MKSIARRHPMAVFLAIAYGASAVIFAVPLLASTGLGVIDLALPGTAPFILLSAIALAAAAFIATALADGRAGVRDLRRRVFHFRVQPGWYAMALLMLPAAALVTAVALAGTDALAATVVEPAIMVTVIAGAVVAFLLVNWWEEAAWTGFALERLQPRLGPIGASVATTWLQALVHLPLVFVADGVTVGRVPTEQIPFYLIALFVLPIPVRVILTWVYNASGRSVPIAGLYHAGLGVATGAAFLPVIAPAVSPIWVYAGFAILAVAILVATRGRLAFTARESVPAASSEIASVAA